MGGDGVKKSDSAFINFGRLYFNYETKERYRMVHYLKDGKSQRFR